MYLAPKIIETNHSSTHMSTHSPQSDTSMQHELMSSQSQSQSQSWLCNFFSRKGIMFLSQISGRPNAKDP